MIGSSCAILMSAYNGVFPDQLSEDFE